MTTLALSAASSNGRTGLAQLLSCLISSIKTPAAALASSTSTSSSVFSSLLMGKRDPRTKKGKIFRGTNGVARPPRGTETGWHSGLRSSAEVPPIPPRKPEEAATAAAK